MRYLKVEAEVRYWEDATVNGKEDVDGTLIPFRKEDLWAPIIDIDEGKIIDWPKGTTADICYKVCDAGQYYLMDEDMNITHKYVDDYVPDRFLCHGDRGYGDYIILKVDGDGKILDYRKPTIDPDQWKLG